MASSTQIKGRQWIIFFCTGALIYVACQALAWTVGAQKEKTNYTEKLAHFNTGSKPVKILENWQDEMQQENEKMKSALKEAQDVMKAQQKALAVHEQEVHSLQTEMKAVKTAQTVHQYQANSSQPAIDNASVGSTSTTPIKTEGDVFSIGPGEKFTHKQASGFPATAQMGGHHSVGGGEGGVQAAPTIKPDLLKVQHLKLERKGRMKHTADSYISAGTFVRAVVTGGAMAGAGTESQAEPPPVLIEVIDYAKLPNKFRRNVKRCRIIASGYGDISSKRAYVRAHTLSCVMKDSSIFEEDVEAYIAGGDSMAGIHGEVIRNEGEMLQNAFLAGFLSTSGNAIQQTLGNTSVSPLGSVHSRGKSDILPSMLADGLTGSANELQKLFVEMAKQHHPVIQVSPGQEVTVVFLKGLSFKGAV